MKKMYPSYKENDVGSRPCGSKVAMTGDRVVSGLTLPLLEEVLWPFLDGTVCVYALPLRNGMSYGELFLFLFE